MSEIIWNKRASAIYNGDFFSIETYSGYTMALADPQAPEHLLSPDVSDQDLGQAVLIALKNSRFLPLEEARALRLNSGQNYKIWVEKIMKQYGYKTKRAMFGKMISCGLEMENGNITIRPSHHEKLEAWSGKGIKEEDFVHVPANSPPEEIGAGLRLAFSRCTGPRP